MVRDRINAMTRAERKAFTRLMFSILEATGAKTLTELHQNGAKSVITMIKAFRELSEEEQDTASYLWDKLVGNRGGEVVREKSPDPPKTPKAPKRRGRIRISFFPLFLP